MQRVITINLNGAAYQLDESAFDRLRAYLDEAALTLADNPDKAEILADFEQAIAEKCRRYLGPQKSVVARAEMDAILAEMGPVDGDLGGDTGAPASSTAPPAADDHGPDRPRRRLYRLPGGPGSVAGVCAGLAATLGIRVAYVRFAFVAFAAASMVWGAAVIYGVLTFLIPEAHTSDERAEAYGERFNAKSMVDEVKRQTAEAHAELRKGGAEFRKSWQAERRHWRAQQRRWRSEWRAHAVAPGSTWSWVSVGGQQSQRWAGFAIVLFAMMSIASIIFLVAALASLLNTGGIYGWPLPAGVPMWAAVLGVIGLFHMLNAPLRHARHASYQAWGRPHMFAAWDGVFGMALLIGVIVALYHRMPPPGDFGDFMRYLPDAFRALAADVVRWFEHAIDALTAGR